MTVKSMKFLMKYYLAIVYEAMLMLALTLTLTAIFYMLFGDASHGWKRVCLQGLLWLSMGGYFVRCWVITGQTLASQTWHLKLVTSNGGLLTVNQALIRYLLASLLMLPAGLALWWAIFDIERCALHDRLLGTRLKQV